MRKKLAIKFQQKRWLSLSISMLFTLTVHGQSWDINLEPTVGIRPVGDRLAFSLASSIGYSFTDYDYTGLGLMYHHYGSPDDDTFPTKNIEYVGAFIFYASYKRLIPLSKKVNEYNEVQRVRGLLIEPRGYLNPHLAREIRFYNSSGLEESRSLNSKAQIGFGVGVGFYFENSINSRYWAIKVEYRRTDPYELLRKLENPFATVPVVYPGKEQISAGLSFFFY